MLEFWFGCYIVLLTLAFPKPSCRFFVALLNREGRSPLIFGGRGGFVCAVLYRVTCGVLGLVAVDLVGISTVFAFFFDFVG